MRDMTLMPNDYIVTHVKTDTICEHFSNDDVVYAVEERVVPLVRCGECKYWHKNIKGGDGIPIADMCYDFQADDFCSYGEREGE